MMRAFVCSAGLLVALAIDARAESLEIQGTTYPSSCEPEAWGTLAAALRSAAGGRMPEALVGLVQPYLCGGDGRAAEIVLRAAPVTLTLTSEGTGEPTTRRRVKSREVLEPRGGQAWDASVTADRGDVSVTFFINEACVRSLTLRATKTSWRVHALGEACD